MNTDNIMRAEATHRQSNVYFPTQQTSRMRLCLLGLGNSLSNAWHA